MITETFSFGEWIRRRRRVLDLTQDQLADLVGCSSSAIRKIEADGRRPSRQVAERLAAALEIADGERATFLKVARMQARVEQLAVIAGPALGPGSTARAPAQPLPAVLNLPRPTTMLVGRDAEVARIVDLLSGPDCRLLTLTGPGGIGKTRLAIAAAEALAPFFAGSADSTGGACFVPFAAVNTLDAICTAIAAALGLGLRAADAPQAQVIGWLHNRRFLLVLDNLEHLLAGAGILAELLEAAPNLRILATSREQLGLLGEWVLAVEGLSVPMPASMPAPVHDGELPANWDHASAPVLFLQAARRANPDFVLHPTGDYSAVASICRMVEGSPLGIELAAAWVRILPCAEIVAELGRSFDLLATTARNVPERQRSLRAAFEYSWQLLADDERRMLAALSVFAGGFTRAAAEYVAGATLRGLAALAAKSLVALAGNGSAGSNGSDGGDGSAGSGGRYDLHEVVRQYAAAKLVESGALADVRRRHWQYFLNLAQVADDTRNSPQHMPLTEALDREHDNLQAALDYLLEHDPPEAWRLAGVLEAHWYRRPVREARQWLARLVADGEPAAALVEPGLRARVLLILATFEEDFGAEVQLLEQALALARKAGEHRVTAIALAMLTTRSFLGQSPGWADASFADACIANARYVDTCFAEASFAEARRLAEEAHDQATLATVLVEQGIVERLKGNYAQANELYKASLAAAQAIGRTDLAADAQYSLGVMALRQGDPRRAAAIMESTLAVWEDLRDQLGMASAQLIWARAATLLGDYPRAQALVGAAGVLLRETGAGYAEQLTLPVRSNLEYALGHLDAARGLHERLAVLCAGLFEPITLAAAELGIALCALRQGDLAAAAAAIERGGQQSATAHEPWYAMHITAAAAQYACLRGELELAAERYRAALQQALTLGERHATAEALEGLAQVETATGQLAHAAGLFGAAAELRRQIGAPVPPVDQPVLEAAIAAVRSSLNPAEIAEHWSWGEAQAQAGLEQAAALALDDNRTGE